VPTTTFQLSLLGRFELAGPNGPIDLTSKKLGALLAFLACTAAQAHSRDKLMTLLWGSHFEAQARQNLRQALTRLRRVLGDDAIISTGESVSLQPSAIASDVARFEELLSDGGRDALSDAIGLYRGSLLAETEIPEEAWTEWLVTQRQRLEGLALDAMVKLASEEFDLGNFEEALKTAQRATSVSQLREDAHRIVMRTLAATGRRADALKHYGQLAALLKSELNVEPDESTQKIARELRQSTGQGRQLLSNSASTHYTKSDDVFIAYQVTGRGPVDLLLAPGFISHLDHAYEDPQYARWLNDLSSFSRLIRFDKRGTGLSDRGVGIPHLEERTDDIRAVLDAVNSEKAVLMGVSEGGPMAILFAATFPERVAALVLYGCYAYAPTDVPFLTDPYSAEFEQLVTEAWGTGKLLADFAPDAATDTKFRAWWAQYERLSASPSGVINLRRMNAEVDVRHLLPTVRVPTLVLHKEEDCNVLFQAGQRLAAHIPGTTFVRLPGKDHSSWVGEGAPRSAIEIQKFLQGIDQKRDVDAVLVTVLAVNMGGSTPQPVTTKDAFNRPQLINDFRARVRRFRGKQFNAADGCLLWTFDGPARAIRCAHEIVRASATAGVSVKAGLHTGEVQQSEQDVRGIPVQMARDVCEMAGPGQVFISSTVKDLVAGAGLEFEKLGSRHFKELEEPVRIYRSVPPSGV
jgi:DNA-binding SARP family transcriptional activator/pimeloyl-ACP methyl ester carboxylesterase